MKLLFLRPFSDSDMSYLKENLSPYYNFIVPENFDETTLLNYINEAEVCIGNKLFKELIHQAKSLKLIQVPGVGVNNINLDLLKNTNIVLCNSHSNSIYVAEYAISLLFTLLKKTNHHDRLMREGKWFRPENKKSDVFYLNDTILGKTVGILGFGQIGQAITKFLKGFGVDFLIFDKNKEVEHDSDLDHLLSNSDIIFSALPLTPETRNLINENKFSLMKPGAYIINVSRAPIINQKALYYALYNHEIAGAATDVWYDDVYTKKDKKYPSERFDFHKLENIVLSSYRAGYLKNKSPHLFDVVKNLLLYAREGKIINQVDIKQGF